MTTKLGGRPYKDEEITDNFNRDKIQKPLTMKQKRQINMQKARNAKALKLGRKIDSRDLSNPIEESPAPEPKEPQGKDKEKDDVKLAYQMLQDLRHAYRYAPGPNGKKGRSRLLELMKSDAEFKSMVKELVKVETSLVAASIRKTGDGPTPGVGTQNFFVVLKGLEEEKTILPCGEEDKTVDLKQIRNAIDPDRMPEYQEATAGTGRNALPQQLTRAVESV